MWFPCWALWSLFPQYLMATIRRLTGIWLDTRPVPDGLKSCSVYGGCAHEVFKRAGAPPALVVQQPNEHSPNQTFDMN
jgi:hypothetical protein